MPIAAISDPMSTPDANPPSPAVAENGTGVLAFPASVAQQMFWYLELLQGTVTAFNVPLRFRLTGPLDISLFERALNAVVERHESLRTCFGEEDGELLQIVSPEMIIRMPVLDISHLPADRINEEADRLGSIEAHRPFDLSKAPLLRAEILRLGPEHHIFHFTVHHALFDGMSMTIFTGELSEFYQAFFGDRAPKLDPLAIQYGDYSVWQKEFLEGPKVKEQLGYWKKKLSGMKEVALPTDFPRPKVKSWKGDITSILLPKEVSEKLQTIAANMGGTLFHVHLAAFMMLLHRYSGESDVAVGAPVAGRSGGDLEPLIGVFINTVILRSDLSGNPSFSDYFSQIREMSLESLENQELPFEKLVHELRPERDPSRNPLFQVNFNHHRSFTTTEHFGGCELTTVPSRSPGAIFDLHLFLVERDEGWRASLDFCTELFTRETANRMLGHLKTLLEDIAAHPEKHIADFEILPPATTQVHLLDGDMRPVPDGMPGELYMAAGDHVKPAGTADGHLIEHSEFGKLLRSGDICRREPDGTIGFIGRKGHDAAPREIKQEPKRERPSSPTAEPAGSTESRLTAIWQDLLGFSDIGRDDDFFALGGHSLMTLRMFSRIHREFGITLPLATLLKHPTIASLASQIDPPQVTQAPAAAAENTRPVAKFLPKSSPPAKSNIITLTEGSGEKPLFCIHGGDGGVIFYRSLASLMPPAIPFHAIESLELGNSGGIVETSIEETASCYLRDILSIQKEGPFRLAGYSFGGVVAHEIACQLVEQGHKVEFLGMFDTDNPTAPIRNYSLSERLGVFWRRNHKVPLGARVGLVRERICEGVQTNRRIKAELKAAKTSGPAEAYSDRRRIQVREENWRAMQAYQPRPFAGRITLFKTTHISDKYERLEDYGWRAVAGAGLEIVPVEGEHLALFATENVENLAKVLTNSLNTARPAEG